MLTFTNLDYSRDRDCNSGSAGSVVCRCDDGGSCTGAVTDGAGGGGCCCCDGDGDCCCWVSVGGGNDGVYLSIDYLVSF